ncbi:Hypothetical_protein [Hexamita inflata]|uniref:Hypothetical_protein n=1 Tax=Hexamita inflata TaxID=28002 RepID=A0AA86PLG0_9EUKA|nr:Hypothetical protein HINF_LOCUS25044 [Hexamita inflata]
MTRLVESKFMHWITFICMSLLALSASILMFVYFSNFSLDGIFKTLFLVLCSLILAVSPWDKKIDELFKFMKHPFWKSGLILMLGLFQCPCFQHESWVPWAFIFQNVSSIAVIVLGLVHFPLAFVDHFTNKNNLYEHQNLTLEA